MDCEISAELTNANQTLPLNQASRWSLINLKKNNYSILAPTFIHMEAGRLVVKGGGPTATTTSPVGQVK